MEKRTAYAVILVLAASILPEIVVEEVLAFVPGWLPSFQFIFLCGISIISVFDKKLKIFYKYSVILTLLVGTRIVVDYVSAASIWLSVFDLNTFTGNFGSEISLKFIRVIILMGFLHLLLKNPRQFYLNKGDLSVKADKIGWLGIEKGSINWGRLSILSAVLISLGTLLLTIVTVTGFSAPEGLGRLPGYLPVIIIFAFVNSFCEGTIFRSSILGTLNTVLPKKHLIITAAVYFGIAHYYGAPGGVPGVLMSGILGWYMCRSMYETGGFLSSWIIHFAQDIVIFSSIFVLGNFII